METPKISIIIPVFNVEPYVERCARSLFAQSMRELEYIFVDDCSPDMSISIINTVLQDFPMRKNSVTFIKHTENKGLTSARNSGLAVAKGEFVMHCDSDDWLSNDMCQKLYASASASNSDIVYSDFYMVFNSGMKVCNTLEVNDNRYTFLKRYMMGLTVLWNFIAKRQLYDEYQLRSPEYITYCEDFHLSIRLFYYASKISKVSEPLYYYNRTNVTSLLNTPNIKAREDSLMCFNEVANFLRTQGVYDYFEKEICWRILNSKQDWILSKSTHDLFLNILPESNKYLIDCPYLNFKVKVLIWCKLHHMGWVTNTLIILRSLFGR